MRRASALLVVLALGTTAPLTAQSDSTSTTSTAPTFHAEQWAARFGMANSVYGIGAIHFSTPTKAWTLLGSVNGSYNHQNGTSSSANNESISLAVGRRWYRPATARVRPFGGLGVSGGFGRSHQVNGQNSQTSRGFGGGLLRRTRGDGLLRPRTEPGSLLERRDRGQLQRQLSQRDQDGIEHLLESFRR